MSTWRNANLMLAFLIELGMLAGFCYAGWAPVLWLRVVLAIGLPALAITLWAVWAPPAARKRRLRMPALLIFKIVMFAAATAAWWVAGQNFIAAIFAGLAVVNLGAATLFRQV
jgi:hypothetical protein